MHINCSFITWHSLWRLDIDCSCLYMMVQGSFSWDWKTFTTWLETKFFNLTILEFERLQISVVFYDTDPSHLTTMEIILLILWVPLHLFLLSIERILHFHRLNLNLQSCFSILHRWVGLLTYTMTSIGNCFILN